MNPRVASSQSLSDRTEVSFVPMAAVEEETGRLDASQNRALESVRKGYTPFAENDVIFAKITPCMENGKIALATGLKNELAYGSTEFFVFRPYKGLLPRFLLHFLLQPSLREAAEHQMSGASGQKRVPAKYLFSHEFLLPPTCEQERIVARLDAALSAVERAETAARRAQERLKRYRAAVLYSAVTGELTRNWREAQSERKNTSGESGEALLQRVLVVRRALWEKSESERRRVTWKSRYSEPVQPDIQNLPTLPQNWTWASLDQLLSALQNGISQAPRETDGLPILRISAVRAMRVDLSDCRYLPLSTAGLPHGHRKIQ